MIMIDRQVPIRIRKNEALLRRLINHPDKRTVLERDLKLRLAGFNGEKAIDYYLRKLPNNDYFILHGLRLKINLDYFQIDTLILTEKYALIIEIKNIAGELYFDTKFNQLIQTTPEGGVKGYQNPIQQARYQKQDLEKLFQNKEILLPIEYLVTFSKPSTIIKTNSQYAISRIIHAQYLIEEIERLNEKYKMVVHEKKTVKRMAKILIKLHCPETYDILKVYDLTQKDVKKGVCCINCGYLPMKRVYGSWICQNCGLNDVNAHISAIEDYFLLVDTQLTNQNFREFTYLKSDQTAKRLLNKMNLPYKGILRGRFYYQDVN